MTIYQWIWFVLIYLLTGQIFSLVYILVLKPTKENAWIGMMGLFFPLYLIIDLVATFATGFGAYSKIVLARFEAKKDNKK